MMTIIKFLLFPLMLILLPIFLYRSCKPLMMSVWYRLAFHVVGLKLATSLLAIAIILFNLTYVAVFHVDVGFIISTLIMFFMLSNDKNVRLLLSIRRNKYQFIFLAVLTVVMLFIPNMFSTSYTLAAILECAGFFPAGGMQVVYCKNLDLANMDKIFVDAYFT